MTSDFQPFFLYLAPAALHEPATPAERHQGACPPSFYEEDVWDKPLCIWEIDGPSDGQISEIHGR